MLRVQGSGFSANLDGVVEVEDAKSLHSSPCAGSPGAGLALRQSGNDLRV